MFYFLNDDDDDQRVLNEAREISSWRRESPA